MKKMCVALSLFAAAFSAFAAPIQERMVKKEFKGASGEIFRYRWAEKLPNSGEKVPLVIFLHGAGERGTDNTAQLRHGVTELLDYLEKNEKGYRILAGQVPHGKRWVEVDWAAKGHEMPKEPSLTMGLLLELLENRLSDSRTDTARVYVTGISMGGFGTWDIISRRPEVFAAAMPICGGGDTAQASKMGKVSIWAFHGSSDGAVRVSRSRDMMSALWATGANVHYREYPDAGHNVWTTTYRDNAVLKWFFSRRRKN